MTLNIKIHDVGHGQAIHAFTPNGKVIVIDLGQSSNHSPLNWLSKRTKTIDFLIITHPHGDHIDEISLLEKFNVTTLWRPKWLTEETVIGANQSTYEEKINAYFDLSNSFNSPVDKSKSVTNPNVNGGVSIKVFSSKNCGLSNINNHSGVVVFEYHGVTVIIPGDNEPPSWKMLMEQPDFVKAMNNAHVFMASHHGRKSGYHADIFKKEKPNLCIVSDGNKKHTDVTNYYSNHAKGWTVKDTKRYCLTTRTDGHIDINIWKESNQPYLNISTLDYW